MEINPPPTWSPPLSDDYHISSWNWFPEIISRCGSIRRGSSGSTKREIQPPTGGHLWRTSSVRQWTLFKPGGIPPIPPSHTYTDTHTHTHTGVQNQVYIIIQSEPRTWTPPSDNDPIKQYPGRIPQHTLKEGQWFDKYVRPCQFVPVGKRTILSNFTKPKSQLSRRSTLAGERSSCSDPLRRGKQRSEWVQEFFGKRPDFYIF